MTVLVTAFAAYFKEGLSILNFHFKKEFFSIEINAKRLYYSIKEMSEGHNRKDQS